MGKSLMTIMVLVCAGSLQVSAQDDMPDLVDQESTGRNALSSKVTLSPREVHRLPIVTLDMHEHHLPKSYLYRITNSDLTLISRSRHLNTWEMMYFRGRVSLNDIEAITVVSRQRRLRINITGAVVGGLTGYMVGRWMRPDPIRQRNIEVLGQWPVNGFVEPALGAIIGASLGVCFGEFLAPVRIEGVSRNPSASVRALRRLSPPDKTRKR